MNTLSLKPLIIILLSSIAALSAQAGPYSYRNATVYDIADPTVDTGFVSVWTNPIQAYEPVYAWREHLEHDGEDGSYGYAPSGELVGYTDANGVWSASMPLANLPAFNACGEYKNERFSVGSRSNPKTPSNTFYIFNTCSYDGTCGLVFGPYPNPSCLPENFDM